MPSSITIYRFLVCVLLATCAGCEGDKTSTSAEQNQAAPVADLPDPMGHLTAEKTQRLLIEGAEKYLAEVPGYYPGYADVIAQTRVAGCLLKDSRLFSSQRPVVLYAGILDFPVGTRLHVDAINTHRETNRCCFWYSSEKATYQVVHKIDLECKQVEFLFTRLFGFRRCSWDELDELALDTEGDVRHIHLPYEDNLSVPETPIPLPVDVNVPVFASIHDRNGKMSSAVLLHQQASGREFGRQP